MSNDLTEMFGELIDTRSRADAISAGDLIEVPTKVVREAKFSASVVLTRAVWADCVTWTDEDAARTGAIQDEDGRLWDVLWMAASAFRGARRGTTTVCFQVWRVHRHAEPGSDGDIEPTPVYLIATLLPDGITISLPGED